MQKLVFMNPNGEEIDFTSGDFGVTRWEGFSHTDMEVQSQQVPFHDGSVFLDALLAERELSITVAVNDGGDLEKRYRLKRELIHCLNPKLGEGELIYTNDYTSKKIVCVPAIPEFENKNMNDRGTLKASCSFTASSPYWEDVEGTEIDLGKGFVEIENKGDIETNMKIDAYTNEIKNFRMKNLTNNKEISFSKTVNDNFIIDTNFGKKRIIENNLVWKDNSFNSNTSLIKFINELNLFIRYGGTNSSGLVLFSYDLINWEANRIEKKSNRTINDIIWCEKIKKFLCCSSNGIFNSQDGKNWTKILYTAEEFKHLYYSKEWDLIIAIASRKIYTSQDGINWTQVYQTFSSDFGEICYSPELEIFICQGNLTIYKSTDGTNWTENSQSIQLRYIEYYSNLNLFLATRQNNIYKSTDGINWELYVEESGLTAFSNKILYDPYLDRYVKYSLYYISSQKYREIYVSNNLVNWVLDESLNKDLSSLIFCESLNLFVGIYGNGIIKNTDGENWIDGSFDILKTGSYTSIDIVYSEELGLFVEVGGKIITSPDGINWTKVYDVDETPETSLLSICYCSDLGLFVAVGVSVRTEKKGIVFTSPDGINWTSKFVDYRFTRICYSSDLGLFVAVGQTPEENPGTYDYKGVVYTSPDGINWDYSILSNLTECRDICYSSDLGLFVGVGYYYEEGVTDYNEWSVFSSPDGINWSFTRIYDEDPENDDIDIQSICYSEKLNLFVMVGAKWGEPYIMTSPDGINWKSQFYEDAYSSIAFLLSICFSDYLGLFVAVGNEGLIMTSPDGFNWNFYNDSLYSYHHSICYSEKLNMFVICGDTLVYSEFNDGDNIIDYLTEDSDMNFNFSVGKNNLVISGNGNLNAKLKYTQKYLGV